MIHLVRRMLASLLTPLLITTAACGGLIEPRAELSPQARSYLDQVMDLMQNHSINRYKIDWTSFRASVLAEAAGAQTTVDTYPAIRVALGLLGDGHSFLRTPGGAVISVPTRTCTAVASGAPTLPSTIGYVRVSAFSGTAAQASAFANGIQNMLRTTDREDLIGWIVDLRGNTGGNMWPMIAGVGPVLGERIAGYFIDPAGAKSAWEYREGAAWLDESAVHRVEAPYRLRKERPRVAVLTDGRVISSGEAVAIAFRQRPDTRSFGTATCGLSTANRGFPLTDGAVLFLTGAVMADRTRAVYGDSVFPDEVVPDPAQAVQRAIAWLESGS